MPRQKRKGKRAAVQQNTATVQPAPVKQPVQGLAPRRRRRRGNLVKAVQVDVTPPLITPVQNLKVAQGVTKNINIVTPIDQASFEFIPVGLVSLALNRGLSQAYLYYLGIYNDVASIAQGGPGTATTRLVFQNEIYGALAPKTVPFRGTGTIGYKFTEFPTSLPSPALSLDGGLFYYMYVAGGPNLGVWKTQIPPSGYTDQDINDVYSQATESLSGKEKHLRVVRNVELGKRYIRDASAFVRNSSYYGQGAGVGSPYDSLELEVPFGTKMLGTLQQFDINAPRSSRVLTHGSGDSVSNWSIGATPGFPLNYYNTAVTPIFKFCDATEMVHFMVTSIIQAIKLYFQSTPNVTSELITLLTGGFGVTYTQFFIMVRQQLMYMFDDSQAIGQALTPSRSPNGFRPFLVGSNTYGQEPFELITLPTVLNENLRCLKMTIRPYETRNYNNKDNHITHVPVWGTFGGFVPVQYNLVIDGNTYPMFLPEVDDPNTPNVFDGTSAGRCVDFNTSDPPLEAVASWNAIMKEVVNMFSSVSQMGGDALNGAFLQFTRFCAFNTATKDVTNMRRIPKEWQQYVIEVEEEEVLDPKLLTKKPSREIIKKKKKVYAPPSSSIYTEFTITYSGMIPITASHKENFANVILPVMEFTPGSLPGVPQVQVSTLEPYSLDLAGVGAIIGSRSSEIENATINYLTGHAGKGTELAQYIRKLSECNEGAFFGDFFAAIGPIASAVIPGAGGVANALSGVANMIGV